jgi:hypothetical protein
LGDIKEFHRDSTLRPTLPLMGFLENLLLTKLTRFIIAYSILSKNLLTLITDEGTKEQMSWSRFAGMIRTEFQPLPTLLDTRKQI